MYDLKFIYIQGRGDSNKQATETCAHLLLDKLFKKYIQYIWIIIDIL